MDFAALRSANDRPSQARRASIRPELLALSTLRPPAGSRVTATLAAHHCRTRCALWRNFFWTTRRSTNRPWGSLPVRLKRHNL